MKIPRHSKTIRKYILSYTGIALLSCALVGLVLFSIAASELNRADRTALQDKLEIAVGLLDNNLELMRDMTYKLQMSYYFRHEYIIQNGYNPAVTLDYLSRFKSHVPLSEEYFLMYDGSDKVYKVADTAATNDFYVFAKSVLGVENYESLYARIRNTQQFSVVLPTQDENPEADFALFLFPLKFSEQYRDRAVFGFIVRSDNILKYIETTFGRTEGDIYVYCGGTLIASTTGGEPHESQERYTASARDGEFSLLLLPAGSSAFARLRFVNGAVVSYLVVIVVFLIGLALFAAWRNYRPIGQLVQRFHPDAPAQDDELTLLSGMIDDLFEEKRVSSDRLHDEMMLLSAQRAVIRRQLVQLLICGQLDAYTRETLQYLDFPAEDCVYAVLTARIHPGTEPEPLIAAIEDLSDETLSLCGVSLAGGECVAFLCASRDSESLSEVRELAEAVAAELGIPLRCGLGLTGDSLSRIPISFLDALSRTDGADAGSAGSAHGDEVLLRRLSNELENGNREQAERCFAQLMAQAEKLTQPFARMCVFSDIFHVLMRVSYKLELNIGDEKLNIMAIMQDAASFRTLALELIERICRAADAADNTKNAALAKDLLDYIRDNVADYGMSPETLSRLFSLPEKNITRIIRDATGLSYKEYLNEVRIARACELLTKENLSVAETCTLVGLSEVSYFIRVFKKITGDTPANYKRRAASEAHDGT